MIINAYANYGVLAHEYKPVYSLDIPCADSHDRVAIYIPPEYPIAENVYGQPIVQINGKWWPLIDLLTNHGNEPALLIPAPSMFDHYIDLRWCKVKDDDEFDKIKRLGYIKI